MSNLSNLRLEKHGEIVRVFHDYKYLGNISLATLCEFTDEYEDVEAIESYLEVGGDE